MTDPNQRDMAPVIWKSGKIWLGFVLGAVFLWLAARGVDWSEVGSNAWNADYRWVALGASLMVLTWAISALR